MRWVGILAAVLTVVSSMMLMPTSEPAAAISGSDFNPGMIISDAEFYNGQAMSQADIQSFLDARIGSCSNGLCLNVLKQDTYSIPQDRNVCAAYAGQANEPVSRVLYKVQVACGISAKVLLVTLQKEMGLVTSKAPSQWALNHAMGYGCPDTADCDSDRAGFYNQIYSAAWQFKRYSTPTPWGSYQPGWRTIGYNPNPSCGASDVYIQNNATAALYNYTPYQPNSAALGNLNGTGDSCSSYGNRNFWVFYSDWFKSVGAVAINQTYQRVGGASGALGGVVSSSYCSPASTVCSAQYANGSIYWSMATGAWPVMGAIDELYQSIRSTSGSMRFPIADPVAETAAPGGFSQRFQGANAYSSSFGAFAVYGGIRTEFDRLGGPAGVLGWPLAGDECGLIRGGCLQRFEDGVIYYSSSGTYTLSNETNAAYEQLAGPSGELGYPVARPVESTANGGGIISTFQSGVIYSSPAGTFPVFGSLAVDYAARGGVNGSLGWPTSERVCTPLTDCVQTFQNGSLKVDAISEFASPRKDSLGPAIGPRTAETALPGGASLAYRSATVYTYRLGTFAVYGVIRAEFDRLGGTGGMMGWPLRGDQCGLSGGGCIQEFENGTLYYSPATGTRAVMAPIEAMHRTYGTPLGSLGYPISSEASVAAAPGGVMQKFQGANAYSSSLGAFAVFGVFRTEFDRLGGPGGTMGWPVGRDQCGLSGGGCIQEFENGTLYYSPATGTRAVMAPIEAMHRTYGTPLGSLGYPISSEASVAAAPGGVMQKFQGANAYSSSLGAFAVFGVFRAEYDRVGGPGSALGWPVGGDQCGLSGGGCIQEFENGTLFYSPATGTRTVMDPFDDLHRTFGEPLGSMGYAISNEISVAAAPGGVMQKFEGANAYSSSFGAFAVFGVIRAEYDRLGGPDGTLGWPLGGDQCGLSGGGCIQEFENGTIFYSPATGTWTVMAPMYTRFADAGGLAGPLGYPIANEVCVAGSCTQRFQGGTLP